MEANNNTNKQVFMETKGIINALKPILYDKYGVNSIGLFGSVVRNDFNMVESDVDIAIGFDKPIGIEFIDIANLLENHLKRKVDLVSINGIKKKYWDIIKEEIVYV